MPTDAEIIAAQEAENQAFQDAALQEREDYLVSFASEEQAILDDMAAAGVIKTETERVARIAWQADLDAIRAARPAQLALQIEVATRNRLEARDAAEDVARAARGDRGGGGGRP